MLAVSGEVIMSEILLKVKDLKQHFRVKGKSLSAPAYVKAVDSCSFHIKKGKTFGLVGESGCGKSTIGRTILRLYEPTGGSIEYDGADITKVDMKPYRKRMQIVFQDPYSSLNPRMTVGDIVGEPLDINKTCTTAAERREVIIDRLNLVGLNTEHMNRYPHEFSGGQRQRISIARALALNPEFIICDEPVSALDVSIQAQVINKFIELQESMGLSYLFISHDLSVVRYISEHVGVMYLGKMMEMGETDILFKNPVHPYTQALFSVAPDPELRADKTKNRIILEGDVPSPIDTPSGCYFRTRCRYAKPECSEVAPEMREVEAGHYTACHLI